MSGSNDMGVAVGEYTVIAGNANCEHSGKTNSSYSGAVVVLLGQDGSIVVHSPGGEKPQFYVSKPDRSEVRTEGGRLTLRAASGANRLQITFNDITFTGTPFSGSTASIVADGGILEGGEPAIEFIDLKMGGYYLFSGNGSAKYGNSEHPTYVGQLLLLIKPDGSVVLHRIDDASPYSSGSAPRDMDIARIGSTIKARIDLDAESWVVQLNNVSYAQPLFPVGDAAVSLGYLHKKPGAVSISPAKESPAVKVEAMAEGEYSKEEALVYLKQLFGDRAEFRPGQWEAINGVVNKKAKILLVQSTGWGKSVVYFLATKLMRMRGAGPTVVISPLLSLMRNQMIMAKKLGLAAETINSDNSERWEEIEAMIREDKCDLLLVSPERLGNERFLTNVIPAMAHGIGIFVVDEAHCISDWGHDFRPDYRRIVKIIEMMPSGMPILATTATANNRVVQDIMEQMGNKITPIRGALARHSLRLMTILLKDQAERLAWLAENVPRMPGSGIIYCLTQKDCELVSAYLKMKGILVEPYHAGIDGEGNAERQRLETALLNNEVKALAATIALGMGFDKPDLGFVVHFQRPGSLVAYYQQIGRAGRNSNEALAILLSGEEDDEIAEYFIRSAFPTEGEMQKVLDLLDQLEDGGTLSYLQANINLSKTKVDNCLKHLQIAGAVTKTQKKYYRTPNPWEPNLEKAKEVTDQRLSELEEIKGFVRSDECLMRLVCQKLDDPHAGECKNCANCAGDFFPRSVDHDLVIEATEFIRGRQHVIQPRRQWTNLVRIDGKYKIPSDKLNQPGKALCVYGDAGWGRLVREDKYHTKHFRDELVAATSEIVRREFGDLPGDMWVTAVPSLRMPELVPDFAKRLAASLDLPYHDVIVKVKDVPPQKTMENSEKQLMNISDAFTVNECPSGPVLLVDDMVDSGWTFTVCGYMLRKAGSGPVYPVALAVATKTGDK